MGVEDGWVEIGDRFFVRRYAFYDQNIGLILGDGEALVIDTRSTHVQAREILAHVRELTQAPVTVVVDTHGHFDHAYGNHVFRPATIWGHERCVTFIERTGEARRAKIALEEPDLAADLQEVVIDPPDRTFAEATTIEVGGRPVDLRFLGRGHTDHDIVITVPGTGVWWAGDLLEGGAVPFFGDGYPLDWPATATPSPHWSATAWSCPATATTPVGRSRSRRPDRSARWRRWRGGYRPANSRSTRRWPTRRPSRASNGMRSAGRWSGRCSNSGASWTKGPGARGQNLRSLQEASTGLH